MRLLLFKAIALLGLCVLGSNAALAATASNVVRVNSTTQAHDFSQPWAKHTPVSKRAIGVVLPGARVLVTADCVANATYVELESPDGERKQPAYVDSVDYECNLALLKTEKPDLLRNHPGLPVGSAHVGDSLSVWQLEPNGNLMASKGHMTTAEVVRYPLDESAFLVYRVSVALQMKDSSATLPVIHEGKLAGLMLRYEASSNLMDVIPAPVVDHFLRDSAKKPYEGFPRMGLAYSSTRDPQLRHYLKLDGIKGGVLVTQILPGGPAADADIQKEDVILEVDDQPVDADGNYNDPDYGKIALSHLVATKHFEGETLSLKVLRHGWAHRKTITPARRKASDLLCPPHSYDTPPKYFILGGLVLQELSRPYLREFGSDWARKAPAELLNIDRTQSELQNETRKRVVILNRILPSQVTVGYEEFRHLIVKSINGVNLSSIDDVPAALMEVSEGIHRVEFNGFPHQIFLDAKAVEDIKPLLMKNYRLPALSNLE